ncbi:hypothetical protein MTR67_034776 [Solanum verrucosum]|uniref:Uncharacterized protein n=1 Tax=Solanum verrucosum TaxID=315347 RepID=A0AAF0U925_SOLVR|nr:hypothetical protein MTR67_034776 [Solanum verrucosum]
MEKMKKWHNAKIRQRNFRVGDSVLLYNSRLRLLPDKLKSRWSSPFKDQVLVRWYDHFDGPLSGSSVAIWLAFCAGLYNKCSGKFGEAVSLLGGTPMRFG